MKWLGTALLWLSGVFSAVATAASVEPPVWEARRALDTEFRQQLAELAAKCDELGMEHEARLTRGVWIERDPHRQYLFVPSAARESLLPPSPDDLTRKWHAKLLAIRRAQAERLFALARQLADKGSATDAYQLLHEVLHEDPSHLEARRILRLGDAAAERPRSRSARAVHPQFGWARGRWWQIETPHFQIATNRSPEAALDLARRLEVVRTVWAQVCFPYWNDAASLRADFAGTSLRPNSRRRHQVVLFRDREEYVAKLTPAEPQIALTLGYYHKGTQTSYFYAGDDSLVSVWNHEATHQLFQETGEPLPDVGERWNFWVVEGVAVYFESLRDRGACFTLGGFDADRLQFVRSRVLGGEPQLPLSELVRLGRAALQQHADIRRIYTQSAGLAHFFFDFDRGKYRERFLQFVASVYAGSDHPESLLTLLELTEPQLEQEWKAFLTVDRSELQYLAPSTEQPRRHLSLIRANLENDSLALLAGEKQLEWLDLSFTPIRGEALRHLGGLNRLKRLTLVGVAIGDEAATLLAHLTGLEELDLSGTAVTDQGLSALAKLKKLKVLRLSHTSVSDAGIAQLASLDQLEELDVEETRVTAAGLAAVQQQLPKLNR